jgi:beta-glucuronidase
MNFPVWTKRTTNSLNGVWQFKFTETNDFGDDNISGIEYDDLIAVPGSFDATPAYNGKRGIGFYRTTFTVAPGEAARLLFGAVGMYCKVFVDGCKVGEQYAAYTPFQCDLPPVAKQVRELVVMACNRFDYERYQLHENFFDFYAYGGIFRDVELQQLPAGSLIEWVGVDTIDYKTGALQVKIKSAPGRQTLELTIDGSDRQEFKDCEFKDGQQTLELVLKNLKPWSPEYPELHTLTVANETDAMTVRFGVRQVWTEKGRIILNGKAVKLLGYCRHESHPQYGPALPLAQLISDLQMLRDLGCNFVRGSHYQQDPRFLSLCDELGFLVFEESMSWQANCKNFTDTKFIAAQLHQSRTMILSSYNNPCIIIRGFLNEGKSDIEEARDCYMALIKLFRELDPHRLLTYASDKGLKDMFLEQIDVISFNSYPGWYAKDPNDERPLCEIIPHIHAQLEGLKQRGLGDKPYLISEIGAGAIYGWRDPVCAHWSEEYQQEYLRIVCQEVVDNDAVAGVALWQFCDIRTCRGSYALGRPRCFNDKGTVDEFRRPKLAYNTVKAIFKKYNQQQESIL